MVGSPKSAHQVFDESAQPAFSGKPEDLRVSVESETGVSSVEFICDEDPVNDDSGGEDTPAEAVSSPPQRF
ncbi:hypothetical protein U1Q18_003403 [Sarracenia purpurea var. burkii]